MWQQWVLALLGLLVIAVPFMGLAQDALTWTLAVAGIAIIALAVWGGVHEQELERRLQHR